MSRIRKISISVVIVFVFLCFLPYFIEGQRTKFSSGLRNSIECHNNISMEFQFRMLEFYGFDSDNEMPFICSAAKNNNLYAVRFFAQNLPKEISSHDFGGNNALVYAIDNNNLEMIKFLKESKISYNIYYESDNSPPITNVLDYLKISKSQNKKEILGILNHKY